MKFRKFIGVFVLGIAVQAGIYIYLDQVLFAPRRTSKSAGRRSRRPWETVQKRTAAASILMTSAFMATILDDQVTIYEAGKKERSPAHQSARPQRLFL